MSGADVRVHAAGELNGRAGTELFLSNVAEPPARHGALSGYRLINLYPRSSAGVAAVREVLLLFVRRRSAQDRVAVREAAEAPHDVAVMLGLREVAPAEAAAELDGALLVGQVFAGTGRAAPVTPEIPPAWRSNRRARGGRPLRAAARIARGSGDRNLRSWRTRARAQPLPRTRRLRAPRRARLRGRGARRDDGRRRRVARGAAPARSAGGAAAAAARVACQARHLRGVSQRSCVFRK